MMNETYKNIIARNNFSVESLPGSDIKNAIAECVDLARCVRHSVGLRFNGKLIVCGASDDVDKLLHGYWDSWET